MNIDRSPEEIAAQLKKATKTAIIVAVVAVFIYGFTMISMLK